MRKPDRRKPRTKQLLRDALIALIPEKGYDAISVQDIADRANVGRATFYTHFGDKEALLLDTLHTLFDDLKIRLADPHPPQTLGELPLAALPFQHAAEYQDLYLATLFSEQGAIAISNGIREYLATAITHRLSTVSALHTPSIPIEMVAQYIAGAMLSLIGWWLRGNRTQSAEEMAQIFRTMTLPMLQSVFSESQSS